MQHVIGFQVPALTQRVKGRHIGCLDSPYAVKCPGLGRSAPAGAFMPLLSFKQCLDKVVVHSARECNLRLPEVYDLVALETYLRGCLHRRENVEILARTWQALGRQKLARRGRPDPEENKNKLEMQERGAKLLQAESYGDKLLENLTGRAPTKRRRRKTAEVEVKHEATSMAATCSDHMSGLQSLRSRKHVDGVGAQKFARRVLKVLLPEIHDLDIENCLFTVIAQLLTRLECFPGLPTESLEVLQACCKDRSEICSKLSMSQQKESDFLCQCSLVQPVQSVCDGMMPSMSFRRSQCTANGWLFRRCQRNSTNFGKMRPRNILRHPSSLTCILLVKISSCLIGLNSSRRHWTSSICLCILMVCALPQRPAWMWRSFAAVASSTFWKPQASRLPSGRKYPGIYCRCCVTPQRALDLHVFLPNMF